KINAPRLRTVETFTIGFEWLRALAGACPLEELILIDDSGLSMAGWQGVAPLLRQLRHLEIPEETINVHDLELLIQWLPSLQSIEVPAQMPSRELEGLQAKLRGRLSITQPRS